MTKALVRGFLAAAVLLAVAVPSAVAGQSGAAAKPVIVMKTSNLGKVVATPARLGLYYWNVEKKAGGKIRCTGRCAVVWPPYYVKGTIPKKIPGVMGKLGTIKRGSKRQLTLNGLPAYTYHDDPAGVVLCNNVDGWFVFRA